MDTRLATFLIRYPARILRLLLKIYWIPAWLPFTLYMRLRDEGADRLRSFTGVDLADNGAC